MKGMILLSIAMFVFTLGSAWSYTLTVDIVGGGDFTSIQGAINAATTGDQILVLPGTYYENINFNGKDIVVQSQQGAYKTIINGSKASNVVRFTGGESQAAILNGFTLTNGLAPYHHTGYTGGEYGGGILIDDSSPMITNCIISNNTAGSGGGGILVGNSSAPIFENIMVYANVGSRVAGGGIYADGPGCNPVFKNTLIAKNTAPKAAAVWSNYAATVCLENCTISDNLASYSCSAIGGDGSFADWWKVELLNSIVYGNVSTTLLPQMEGGSSIQATYTLIEGGWTGIGNIDADPLFVSGLLGDYYLSQIDAGQLLNSPALDAGMILSSTVGFDQFTTRTDGIGDFGIVDMGYHYPLVPEPTTLSLLALGAFLLGRQRK